MMEKLSKLKVVVLGPANTGKTTITNALSEVSFGVPGDARKTRGVRIVEFEIEMATAKTRNIRVEVELWDCSGDRRYEPCWPVFFHEADGLILVCTKGSADQKKDLEAIYASASSSKSSNLANNCIILSNVFEAEDENPGRPEKSLLPKVDMVEVNVMEKGDDLKQIFLEFSNKILSRKSKEKKPTKAS